ncbi:MAG: NAD(P)H-dependent oxidoreductase subunit E, partial [Dehalococcoidia bacterium]
MAKLKSPTELEALRKSVLAERDPAKAVVTICNGTGCHAHGCIAVTEAFRDEVKKQKLTDKVDIRATGCHGFCERGPLVVIKPRDILYQRVRVKDVPAILSETIVGGNTIDRLLYSDRVSGTRIAIEHDVPFYKLQKRLVFGNNGLIDPTSINDYLAVGGYAALTKALKMKPEAIIAEVSKAGLRGRGGGGFPTGNKWESTRNAEGDVKYVICNADEGDPGAYMDRSLVEGNPHSVLEGMIIGAFAIGSNQGYIYIRNEYPLAVEHVRTAIQQAEGLGLLGKNVLGSGFDFNIKINRGGGAFICGESTALMAS